MKVRHRGVCEIAWGFLTLKCASGDTRIGKVQRLQLYKYSNRLAPHLRSRNDQNVYIQLLNLFNRQSRIVCMGGSRPRRRNLYHCSLYVSTSAQVRTSQRKVMASSFTDSRWNCSQDAPHERIRVTSLAANVRQGDAPFRPTLPTETEEGRLTVDQMMSEIMPITALSGKTFLDKPEILYSINSLSPCVVNISFIGELPTGQLNGKERWRQKRMDLQWKSGNPCMVPNVLDRTVPGGSHGTSMVAFSHDGMVRRIRLRDHCCMLELSD